MEILHINIIDFLITGLICFIIGLIAGSSLAGIKQIVINRSSKMIQDEFQFVPLIANEKQLVVNVMYRPEDTVDAAEIADFTIDFQKWKSGEYLLVDLKSKKRKKKGPEHIPPLRQNLFLTLMI